MIWCESCTMFGVMLIFVLTFSASRTVLASQEDMSSSSEIEAKPSIPVYPSNHKNNLVFGTYSIPTYPDYVSASSFPDSKTNENSDPHAALIRQASLESWSSIIAKSLVPLSSFALYMGAKVIAYTFKFTAMVLISVALTTCICTFTPLCHITFDGIAYNKTQIAEVAGPFITTENLDKGTVMIGRAIDAFKDIQNGTKEHIGLGVTGGEEVASIVAAMNRRARRHT